MARCSSASTPAARTPMPSSTTKSPAPWSRTAKSPTTHHELSIGICGAIDAVLATAGVAPERIELVSLCTTLATNALVEGKGRPVGAVIIGFDGDVLERAGLGEALGSDPAIILAGGHDPHGSAAGAAGHRAAGRRGGGRGRVDGGGVRRHRAVQRAQPRARARRGAGRSATSPACRSRSAITSRPAERPEACGHRRAERTARSRSSTGWCAPPRPHSPNVASTRR